jgi:hypothetical protein
MAKTGYVMKNSMMPIIFNALSDGGTVIRQVRDIQIYEFL